MTGKARKALEKERAISAAIEAEKARERLIKEMQEEIRMERHREEQQALLEEERAVAREAQLRETRRILEECVRQFEQESRVLEELDEWTRYTSCDGLPDPSRSPDMNTFLFVWASEAERASLDTLAEKYDVVTHLLGQLEEIARLSRKHRSGDYASERKAIARELGEKLENWIDVGCYRLLRHIETDMMKEDRKTARHVAASTRIACCLWAPITLPVGTKRATEKDRKPIEVLFEELDLTIKMPVDVDCYRMAIRGTWFEYDRYSEECRSSTIPEIPEEYLWDTDLLEFCRKEHARKLEIREEQVDGRRLRLEEKKALLERIENPPAPSSMEKRGKRSKKSAAKTKKSATERTATAEGRVATAREQPSPSELTSAANELPYLPTPNEIIREKEEEARRETRKLSFVRCEKTEVNMRKYKILGGAFRVDLIYQPPQPKDIGRDTLVTTLELPKDPKFVPFSRPYEPPPPAPDSERTPEVIEAEMKALEAAMEALALITLKLPNTVLWFEPPLVAHWIPERKIWSTRDIHDIKYNEEKQTIAFRTGRLGIHALAAYKFVHLPFQSWEVKPEMGRNARGGVILSVTTGTVQVEFVVREDMVCLNSIAGGTSTALKGILGEYRKLHLLVERMREAGCDIFPERDAASYLKGLATKHPVAEKHLRECMALLSTAYSFAWSRWNATRDFREIVVQMKELHGCIAKERSTLTVLVTPSRSMTVRCTEVSSEFSDLPLDPEKDEFYADLYHLAVHNAGIKTRLLIGRMSFKLAVTVAQVLERTNVISMSS